MIIEKILSAILFSITILTKDDFLSSIKVDEIIINYLSHYIPTKEVINIVKPIEELTLMNDFIFAQVMRQEKYCKPLLEYILNVKIKAIKYLGYQETIIPPSSKAKSIRLDVYVEDDQNTIYDIEVQTTDKGSLGKRSRYYQSMMDINVLDKGKDYKNLKKSFIIFICNFKPFCSSRYIYTFKTRCEEEPDLLLQDEATKIIINTKGTTGDISDELKAVIQYLDSGITSNNFTKDLDKEVQSVRKEYTSED